MRNTIPLSAQKTGPAKNLHKEAKALVSRRNTRLMLSAGSAFIDQGPEREEGVGPGERRKRRCGKRPPGTAQRLRRRRPSQSHGKERQNGGGGVEKAIKGGEGGNSTRGSGRIGKRRAETRKTPAVQ